MNEKKSTYNYKAQKKYNEKITTLNCKMPNEEAEILKKHICKKGFKSVNAYLLDLIKKDMETT